MKHGFNTIISVIVLLLLPAVLRPQSGIAYTKHNLSVSGPGTITASTEQSLCVFCHTPHTAQSTAPLWNRQQPSSTYTLYASDYLTSLSYPSPSQPNAKSKICLGCHDGTIALGTVYNAPGSGSSIAMSGGVTSMPVGAAGLLGTDLGNDHPVGFTYDAASDPELVTRSWPWNTDVRLDPDASTGRLECHTCHNPHDNQYTFFLNRSNTNAALCTFCHSKSGWSGASVIHRISTATYTPPGSATTTVGEWSCRSCHTSHNGGSGAYLMADTEEQTCLQANCHGSSAPSTNLDIETQLGYANRHPTETITGVHKNPETATYMGANRHAECWDCHNPHEAESGVHDGSTRNISGVLKGVWGVEPSYSSVPTNSTDNDNVWSTVSSYTVVDPVTREYQICLKCHSDYLSGSQRNIAEEIDPDYSSYHGIISGGTSNSYCNANTLEAPWGSYTDANGNRIVWCSDCHGSDDGTSAPQGPHGSNQDNLLVATAVSSSTAATPLCFVCHKYTVYWDGSGGSYSNFTQHAGVKNAHRKPKGCFGCHMYDYSDYGSSTGGDSREIFVHGMNKWFNKRETGTNVTGTGLAADAFVSGYIADLDFTSTPRLCWSESVNNTESATNCNKAHNGQRY